MHRGQGRSRILGLLAFGAAALLSACGGGGGGSAASGPAPLPPVTAATPTPGPVANAPFSVTRSTAVTFAGASVPVALPSAAGFGGIVSLPPPAGATSTTLTQTLTNQAPAGVPALSAGRLPQALRAARGLGQTPIVYVRLSADRIVQLAGSPAFSLTVPAASLVPGATYYVAFLDQSWNLGWQGPAAVDGTALTFPAGPSAFAFQPGAEYWFALIAFAPGGGPPTAQPTASPTPTPAPSATPSPAPNPAVTPTPVPANPATPSPTPAPGATPTPAPAATPSPTPLPVATSTPTPTPPSATPTPSPRPPAVTPSPTPTPPPTATPTPLPTATPTPSPTPSPQPTPSPRPTPTPSPVVTPSPAPTPVPAPPPSALVLSSTSPYYDATLTPTLIFTSTAQNATVLVSESAYAGSFDAVVSSVQAGSNGCTLPQIAVSPGRGTSFTVSSGASAPNPPYCGTATITFSDPRPGGASAQVAVQLTASSIGFQARRRHR